TAQSVEHEGTNIETSENLDNVEEINIPEENGGSENDSSNVDEESAEDDKLGGASEEDVDDHATVKVTEPDEDVIVDDTNDDTSVEKTEVDEESEVSVED